jgi:hypothetical protein
MKTQRTSTPVPPPRATAPAVAPLRRHRCLFVLGSFVAAGALSLSGCGFAVDTPLHVTRVPRAVTPGQDIFGKVGYPDGKITVSLVPEASPIHDGHRTRGETPCTYKRFGHTFKCATKDLPQGLYLVQVTDAGQPGEGTAQAQVAVTDVAGYNPHLVIGDGSETAKPGPTKLRLKGWRPGASVKIKLVDENSKVVFTGSADPDTSGAAIVFTPPLKRGHYNLEATDGLWKINGIEGSYNDAYSGFEVS